MISGSSLLLTQFNSYNNSMLYFDKNKDRKKNIVILLEQNVVFILREKWA